MTTPQEYTYEVKQVGMRWVARQLLDGQLFKSWPCSTAKEARERVKQWKEALSN